jgi:hypothetical protein
MCQLVTIGVPKSLGATLPEFGGPREGFGVTPSRNPYLASIFPTTDLRLDVTSGGCSCDLVGRDHTLSPDDIVIQRRRYEKLGWSRAKIDRALQASTAARSRDHARSRARTFRDGVLALLDRTPSIRLFVHMYSGDFHTEVVSSKGVARIPRADYEASHGAIPEDTLVEVAG